MFIYCHLTTPSLSAKHNKPADFQQVYSFKKRLVFKDKMKEVDVRFYIFPFKSKTPFLPFHALHLGISGRLSYSIS